MQLIIHFGKNLLAESAPSLTFSRNLLHAINLKGLYALRFFGYVKVFFEKVGLVSIPPQEICYNRSNYD